MNCSYEFGHSNRPGKSDPSAQVDSECLIKVYATRAIEAGAELVSTYGDSFWQNKVAD